MAIAAIKADIDYLAKLGFGIGRHVRCLEDNKKIFEVAFDNDILGFGRRGGRRWIFEWGTARGSMVLSMYFVNSILSFIRRKGLPDTFMET